MWASILICAALAALLALAVWGIVRRRKKKRGKCEGCAGFCSGCGGGFCGGCGGSASRGGSGPNCGGSGGTDCGSTDSEDTQK